MVRLWRGACPRASEGPHDARQGVRIVVVLALLGAGLCTAFGQSAPSRISAYEWSVREDAALKAGLEPAMINDALRKNGVLGSDEGEITRVRRATETLFNLVLEARP